MEMENIENELCVVEGIPFIKDPLTFFSSTRNTRIMLSICNNDSWKKDLSLCEKLLGSLLISCDVPTFLDELTIHKDVLKQRLRYPNIHDNPQLLKTSKIWILPNKIHAILPPSEFELNPTKVLETFSKNVELDTSTLSFVKIEMDGGKERMILYKLLDTGYRPSLLCVKWSCDLDTDYSTANIAGHLTNCGYIHLKAVNGYSLYYYTCESLYDTVSWKETYNRNPIIQTLETEFNEAFKSHLQNNLDESRRSSS